MKATTRSRIRPPAVAGRFYESDRGSCLARARELCRPYDDRTLPAALHGAIVPHAGWAYSGRVAGATLATLARHTRARTAVLTGTMHFHDAPGPVLDESDAWMTPMGPVTIDHDLRAAVSRLADFASSDAAHAPDHSLEVQLPLLATAFGAGFRIVPCLVPTRPDAARWGRCLGRLLREWAEPVVVIASSDLTHYGPRFDFAPHGVGPEGCRWARETNDRSLLDLVERGVADAVAVHAAERNSACGGGAIALTIEACRALGAERGFVLEHTDSNREQPPASQAEAADSVGYAGVVF